MNQKSQLYYECTGKGEPLILISGLNADHLFWTLVLPYLQEYFSVITIDNRGVGKSQIFTPDCTTELMAQDIMGLLDFLNIQKANFAGHSLGGCVAQQIALRYPSRVNKLVLCSTLAKIMPVNRISIQTTMEMMSAEIPRGLLVKDVLTRLYSNNFLSDEMRFKNAIELSLSQPVEEARRTYFYQAKALLQHDTSGVINKIAVPTLVIAGEDDLTVSIKNAHYLANNIPLAKMISVPDMGHMLPIENPLYFSNCVLNFLR